MGTTRLGVFGLVGLSAAGLALAAAFFSDFPGARLEAAGGLGSGFLGLAVSLVAVTVAFEGAFVTF